MKGHQVELETMLEYLINSESDEAAKLFHQIVVEKSRNIYTESMGEDLAEAEEELDEEEVDEEDEKLDEDFGGDPKANFADEIEADQDEVDSEEQMEDDDENEESFDFDAEGGDDFDAPDADGEVSEDDRLEDIEAAIVELSAEFHQVASGLGIELDAEDVDMMGDEPDFGDEAEVPGELEPAMDMGMEDDDFAQMESALAEATAFLKNVADAGMGQEGKEVGKGSSKPTNTKSINDETPRKDYGGGPVKFAGGTAESGGTGGTASDEACEDNVNVKPGSAPKVERKPKGEDKSAESLLTGAPGQRK